MEIPTNIFQVYCVDETCLLWKDPPPSPPEYDVKTETEKLTLITCTNMDATHKLSLNILGPYPEPPPPPPTSSPQLKPPSPGPDTAPIIKSEAGEERKEDDTEASSEVCSTIMQTTEPAVQIKGTQTKTEAVSPETSSKDVTKETNDVKGQAFGSSSNQQTPVLLYRKGSTHELTPEVFDDWFYSTFVPQVKESLAARDLPPKAVLILDNSIYHPEHLADADGSIKTIKIPCYVANRSLPSAAISRSLKARYRTRIAKGWINDKSFCKNLTLRRFV